MVGVVTEFDEHRGLGVVDSGPGWRIPFHCTAITDGTRRIAVGTVAAFVVSAGRLGRLEARSVRALPGVVPPGSTLPSAPPVAVEPGEPDEPDGPNESDESAEVGRSAVPTAGQGLSLIPDPTVQPASGSGSLPDAPPEPPFAGPHRSEPVPVPEVADSGEPTPPAGSEASPSAPEESPASPEPPGGPVEWEGPRPDFWAPFDRSPAGPPPTWRTPAAPRRSDEA